MLLQIQRMSLAKNHGLQALGKSGRDVANLVRTPFFLLYWSSSLLLVQMGMPVLIHCDLDIMVVRRSPSSVRWTAMVLG